jgi:hypothetical protein
MLLAPADCVVVTCRIPQDSALHPAPERDQESPWFGFEPGIRVSLATSTAVWSVVRVAGAVRPRVKLLVMVTVTEDCLEGSATLVAVIVVAVLAGKICGAV